MKTGSREYLSSFFLSSEAPDTFTRGSTTEVRTHGIDWKQSLEKQTVGKWIVVIIILTDIVAFDN